NKLLIAAKSDLNFDHGTGNNRVNRLFELRNRRPVLIQGFNVLRKLGPALELVLARDNELRVGKRKLGASNFRVRNVVSIIGIRSSRKAWMVSPDPSHGIGIV